MYKYVQCFYNTKHSNTFIKLIPSHLAVVESAFTTQGFGA